MLDQGSDSAPQSASVPSPPPRPSSSSPARLTAPATVSRISSLDGLRGLAALVVVVHHSIMVSPNLSHAYQPASAAGNGVHGLFSRALAYTPLHLVWGGGEAVIVFFVLSGYVLSLPYVRTGSFPLHEYYGKRLVRLYAPLLAALAGAIALRMWLHDPVQGGSWWLNGHAVSVRPLYDVWNNATLVFGAGGPTTSVLWSLRWEVIFSLLLPLFLVVVRVAHKRPRIFAIAIIVLMSLPILNPEMDESLRYLPVFVIGMWLAFAQDAVASFATRVLHGRGGTARATAALVAVPVLMTSSWMLRPSEHHSQRFIRVVSLFTWMALVIGSVMLIVLAVHHVRLRNALQRSPLQWLGLRSYGLYLVHEPLLVALAMLTATTTHTAPFVLAAVALALIATAGFWRAVEQPSIALARRVGRRARVYDQPAAVESRR